jgi:hypothetical protein
MTCNPANKGTKIVDGIERPSCYMPSKRKKKPSKMTSLKALALDILENNREVSWEEAREVLYPVGHPLREKMK